MDSTHIASFDIPELSATVEVAHVFPAMADNSLLSAGKLCNEGYSVTFTIDNVTIFNKIGKKFLKEAEIWTQDCGSSTCAKRFNTTL
jgi:hypothetical protein